MRKYYKFLIVLNILLFSIMFIPINAAVGYNYSHDGRPIYSTEGLTVSKDGVYTVISDRWTNDKGEKVLSEEFKDPIDLFIYKEENGKDVIYVVDSTSNILYIFDEDMNFKQKIYRFEVRPEDFTGNNQAALKKAKTRMLTDAGEQATAFTTYLTKSKSMDFIDFMNVADIPYENRDESQKFYIDCFGLSGVYRSLRPVRDERGVQLKDENNKPILEDLLYLSDKKNNQVLILDAKDYRVVQVVITPDTINFSGKTFLPDKLVTDDYGRMYIISDGVFEGIMMFSPGGIFNSYKGVNYLTLSFWDKFWRRFLTDEQIALQQTAVNTTFTNLTIDQYYFIYATSRAIDDVNNSRMIKRLNREGIDVLTRNGYHDPKGDLVYVRTGVDQSLRGPSKFSAVTVNNYGVYTIADTKSGRLFTYDDEGNLLYISAGSGNEVSNLNEPVAIRYQGDNIIALDRKNKAVLRFIPTEIAITINKAVRYHYEGNLNASSEEWKKVLDKNPNYEYANIGIGKSLMNEKRYQDAMYYFQKGFNVRYYSNAYKQYRDEVVNKYFAPIFTVVIILGVLGLGYKTYRNIRYKRADDDSGAGDE